MSHTLLTRQRAGWGRALLAVGIVAILICLAAANVIRSNWSEAEDGVLWIENQTALIAQEVSPGSAAAHAGIQPGDTLLAVDGQPIESKAALFEMLHTRLDGQSINYTLLRLGSQELRQLSLSLIPEGQPAVYLVLVGVGIFALLIGALVRVRRPDNQATLHFFWLTVAFFGVFAFSFSGRLDRLDWIFYWADAVSMLLLAPLVMHFALVFPKRKPSNLRARFSHLTFALVYFPAFILGLTQVVILSASEFNQTATQTIELVWKIELVYLAICVLGGLSIVIFALQQVPSVIAKRQLRWVVSGAIFGGLPFTIGYALPFSIGFNPVPFHLTAIPLGLIPLAFAAAITHYRLQDVEVIVKKGMVYTVAIGAMATIYLILERLATEVFLEGSDEHNSIIALLATAVVVLLAKPVKNTIQIMLDRVYYRDRYDYRRALVVFARDLNGDLDLDRLTNRLVTRVTETLVVDTMILMQIAPGSTPSNSTFQPLRWTGFDSKPPLITDTSELNSCLHKQKTISLDDQNANHGLPNEEISFWLKQGIYYFVPCVAGKNTIAVMALGRKVGREPLSSEDMALLAAVAGQIATALENGRLYGKLNQKAAELDRMRQFNENIIESLGDGLVVIDLKGLVIRWNAGLERLYGIHRDKAVGQQLETLFDQSFVKRIQLARNETPSGAVLYRIPLLSRHENSQQRKLVNVATAPLLTPEGSISGVMLIVEDITERVQLEEQLQISEKMASIGLLAAGIAHEVNTPLTGISSFTQMLLSSADPKDPNTRMLKKIEQQTFRAAKIVNGLLNLARSGSSDVTGPTDINIVVNDVLALLEPQLEVGNVRLRRELIATPIVIKGVEFKLQQVFLNLFLNARDAMPTGGWLTIRTNINDQNAVIEIADTGTGIPNDLLLRIYEPFFTTKKPGKGTGLGLSITYGVVHEHNGSIECKSNDGNGTRFTVMFPLAKSTHKQTTEAFAN